MIKVNETVIDHTAYEWGVQYTDKTWGVPRYMDVEDETLAHAYASLLDGKAVQRTVYVGEWSDAK